MTLFTDSGNERLNERRALTLLAASMFAEARELGPDAVLGARLTRYCETLMQGEPRGGGADEAEYIIDLAADGPVLRRLATLMDALALALGSGSAVARLLSHWSARIFATVADAKEGECVLEAPSAELVAIVHALGPDAEHELARRLDRSATHGPLPVPSHQVREAGRARVWTRRTEP